MIQEFENYKVGDFIMIEQYKECALWWYKDAYLSFGKEYPRLDWAKKETIWKIEAIIEPQEISVFDNRHLFFLTHGEEYVCIDPTYNKNSFGKAMAYSLNYEKSKQKRKVLRQLSNAKRLV